ncbi:polyprenyl synthetase family protein [Streptomyces albireticuli]|uniref:Geranylgeranyl diphosphate synthase n=1 Tax=Streptomyces albireticuli TaxID=1940 RepID=A0A2A2D5W9_9ACTN|nr:polyprenyl synthetase family protein [Streptomyces albireticuli]MCD9193436.1 polyprenyl synthetase family protein [Streptomyces albireticuli]PAU47878.1 geranylgeranyl diphosphate synthase [Streptomyces albireticuli]
MTTPFLAAQPLDLNTARHQIDTVLDDFLTAKTRTAAARGLPEEVPQALRDFLHAGGKRLRPLLCVVGWHAAGGTGDIAPAIRAAAALELFHAFALIHDDVMDHSATRRGAPTVHRALAGRHPETGGHNTAWLGVCGAVLVGDVALAWSDELLHSAHPPRRHAALRHVIDQMREEVVYGQYLDLLSPLRPAEDLDAALKVIRYKTAKYTVERPLHTGAALAGAGSALRADLSRFALPLGEAFQLRDDLLGTFGDPARTGKPVLDDLREGKHTVLLALATRCATTTQHALLHTMVGDPALDESGAARICEVLEATGARATVETMIATRYEQALAALENTPYPPAVTLALRRIAALATERAS